ncbi:neutral zinc metallopeptidase [Marinobacter sp. BGYM27]|uniref:KPN_02809 family neutral zinc metallopeptidase n=1 Tax=Marinobacter sp. BGYM27 TaxID=2975597 RepID=UPI0021A2723B|nr:neutral zinc metallopeptidase [Marinobacter sp. BGYM27]MDG5499477.1 zinc metallopeptidase [Marinobacter sp. BGYM27]
MRWRGRRQSSNVQDRRGESPGYASSGAGAMVLLRFLPMMLKSKVGRIVLVVAVVVIVGSRFLGIDLLPMLFGGGGTNTEQSSRELTPQEQEMTQFVSVVLADTEDTWQTVFNQLGGHYQEPTLVLFSGRVNSACGTASSAVGPFYCPGDKQVYLDLSFFQDLSSRYGAPGDFAQAYVIAHEVGHHVQTLLGISEKVQQAGQGRSEAEVNALSVRQELQADCFAGVWGHHARTERQWLEEGDLEEALTAASSIGDDRLQKQGGGQVVPDSFTHGSSEQRVRWFRKGFESGDVNVCDTFTANSL